MGGVLHDLEAALIGNLADLGHLGWKPPKVNDGRLGLRADACSHVLGIDAEPRRLAVAEDRYKAEPEHRQNGGPERRGGNQIPGLQPQTMEGRHQGGGAIGVRQREPASGVFGVRGFELADDPMS